MTSQAFSVDQAAAARLERREPVVAGAWLLPAVMLVSGVLTYAFHVLAARSLGPQAYGQIAVLWAAMFLGAVVLFRPLEQTVSRAIADRLARGQEVKTVLRSVGLISAATLAATLGAAAVGWRPISERLFLGDGTMTLLLLGGIALYGVAYLVRGLTAGARWFGGYALALVADAVARLAVASPLVFFASQRTAAAAVVAAGAGGALAPIWFGRRRLRSVVDGRAGSPFRLGSALAFAAPASVIAGADQLLVNGGPLLVVAGGGRDASRVAGVVFAATMLVRVPVYVFQGLAASLLPNLTHLQACADGARFRRAVVQTAAVLLAVGGLIVGFAAAVGPQAMGLLYGSGFAASRAELSFLGAGVGCYLAAATFSQALLAMDCGVRAAAAWLTSAALFVGMYALLPGDPLARISQAFALAALAGVALLATILLARIAER